MQIDIQPEAPRRFERRARDRQRGSIVINTAIALSLIVIALIGTELGYLFYVKRDLQKAVDLAALAGAQSIEATSCASARTAARTNANGSGPDDPVRNLPHGFTLQDDQIECGRWDPTYEAATHFTADETDHNAVRIVVDQAPPSLLPFFPGARTLRIEAVAAVTDPLASFSVGSTLLRTGESVLGDLLKGIGLDLTGTSLVGYDGLAQAHVTPAGLLEALGIPVSADMGVGELNALLAGGSVQLGALLDAIVTLAGQDTLLGANAGLLNAIQARVGVSDLPVQLGSATTPAGLFAQIDAPSTGSVLETNVNALDLIYSAIGVATKNHALETTLDVANLVKAKVAVIEPPSIAIGGIGATAYTAQVRAFVDIDTGSLPIIGSTARIKLPIMIDLVNGRGTITDMCTSALRRPDGTDQAEIAVNASIAKICIGRPGADPADEDAIFSTSASCDDNLSDDQLLDVTLLGLNVVSLRTHFDIDALPLQDTVTLAAGDPPAIVGNQVQLGSTLADITNALLAVLLLDSLDKGPTPSSAALQNIARDLWGPACGSRACRISRLTQVKGDIEASTSGLGGFLGGLTADALGILHQTLDLNLPGLLTGIGSLVGGVLQSVGDLLGAVLGGLLGGCTALIGSNDAACINNIAQSLGGSSSTGSQTIPNAVVGLVGLLLQTLQPILDALGSTVLTALLNDILGLRLGEIDVNLMSLQCEAQARLVY